MFIDLPNAIFHYGDDTHQHKYQDQPAPSRTISSTQNIISQDTQLTVFLWLYIYESIFDMFFRIHFFGVWIYGILHWWNFTQCVNICHISLTDIEKLFEFKRLIITWPPSSISARFKSFLRRWCYRKYVLRMRNRKNP